MRFLLIVCALLASVSADAGMEKAVRMKTSRQLKEAVHGETLFYAEEPVQANVPMLPFFYHEQINELKHELRRSLSCHDFPDCFMVFTSHKVDSTRYKSSTAALSLPR